jgi:hypothetical protein
MAVIRQGTINDKSGHNKLQDNLYELADCTIHSDYFM